MAGKLHKKTARAIAIASRVCALTIKRDEEATNEHLQRIAATCELDGTQKAFATEMVAQLEHGLAAIEHHRQRVIDEVTDLLGAHDRRELEWLRAKLRSIACSLPKNASEHGAMKTYPTLLAELGAAFGTHEIPKASLDALRTLAASGQVARFELDLAESTAKAPPRVGSIDPVERHQFNPHLPDMMRAMGLTAADLSKHGPRTFTSVPNLRELISDTSARGDAMGVGPGKSTER